jgi:hypothetical protein
MKRSNLTRAFRIEPRSDGALKVVQRHAWRLREPGISNVEGGIRQMLGVAGPAKRQRVRVVHLIGRIASCFGRLLQQCGSGCKITSPKRFEAFGETHERHRRSGNAFLADCE